MRAFLGWISVGWCGQGCDVHPTYGFTPECGCPVHDPSTPFHVVLSILALMIRTDPRRRMHHNDKVSGE